MRYSFGSLMSYVHFSLQVSVLVISFITKNFLSYSFYLFVISSLSFVLSCLDFRFSTNKRSFVCLNRVSFPSSPIWHRFFLSKYLTRLTSEVLTVQTPQKKVTEECVASQGRTTLSVYSAVTSVVCLPHRITGVQSLRSGGGVGEAVKTVLYSRLILFHNNEERGHCGFPSLR